MLPAQQAIFAPLQACLTDGRVITIRMLHPCDGEALADFYESVPREDFRFYCPHELSREAARSKVARGADADGYVCLIASDPSRRIGGYAWYQWDPARGDESEFGICIGRDFQGTGAGRALMLRLFEVAKTVGPPRMKLSVQLANFRALELYRKMGFEVIEERVCPARWEFPAEPEYVMERLTR